MKVHEGAITSLTRRGNRTLQVPQTPFGPIATVELPDEWFTFLKVDLTPTTQAGGFTFLTKKGYEENKDSLKMALFEFCKENKIEDEFDKHWYSFQIEAESHFKKVQERIDHLIKRNEKEIADLKKYVI